MRAFHGSITALITPFKNGAVDWPAFERLIEVQIAAGTHGLVICGTTGESPTLSHDEHMRIVERAVALVKGRIPVIAGTGSNSTQESINLTTHAHAAGADAALIVTPYYNKPTQEGLYAHYRAIAEAVPSMPIILYNIPGRSIVDIKSETMGRLAADFSNIIGVKDATADLERPAETRAACGDDFIQLSGEDATVLAFLEAGGHGCISVTSNIAPDDCAALHNAWAEGRSEDAAAIDQKLAPLHKALFIETSPQPAKYAASRLGLCQDEMRLPLLPASETARKAVDRAMEACGLLANL